jgi:hypothetical protein
VLLARTRFLFYLKAQLIALNLFVFDCEGCGLCLQALGGWPSEVVMERRFSIEAKAFCLSAKEGFHRGHFSGSSMFCLVGGYGGRGDSVTGEGRYRQVLL